ncbi:hypothetical protein F5Y14DRAFT_446950 [Nemania sp. NC0429]|nr:hypothetical protein F5Y14DRAFT_446950 [Nemania sp. NC0429]
MVHEDINMNAARNDEASSCVNPTTLMYTTAAPPVSNLGGQHNMNGTEDNTHHSGLYNTPITIRCKLYFIVAAHKIVQTGKVFVAVARIPHGGTSGGDNRFVNAQGKAYHYIPDRRRRQFNTSIPLSEVELAGASCDDRAFAVHKTTGTSCAPAGTYLVYLLRRAESGTRNLRFEATWDWGGGVTAQASYDFVSLTAQDGYNTKPYTSAQQRLLSEVWPEWKDHVES